MKEKMKKEQTDVFEDKLTFATAVAKIIGKASGIDYHMIINDHLFLTTQTAGATFEVVFTDLPIAGDCLTVDVAMVEDDLHMCASISTSADDEQLKAAIDTFFEETCDWCDCTFGEGLANFNKRVVCNSADAFENEMNEFFSHVYGNAAFDAFITTVIAHEE